MILRPKDLLFQVSLCWLFSCVSWTVSYMISFLSSLLLLPTTNCYFVDRATKPTWLWLRYTAILTLMRLLTTSCLLLEARTKKQTQFKNSFLVSMHCSAFVCVVFWFGLFVHSMYFDHHSTYCDYFIYLWLF